MQAELLTGLTIRTEADASRVCDVLHARGPRVVVLTSVDYGGDGGSGSDGGSGGSGDSGGSGGQAHVVLFASQRGEGGADAPSTQFRLNVPRLPGNFTGTGDLLAALLLAWVHRHPNDLQLAVEKATATVQAVLKRTVEAVVAAGGDPAAGGVPPELLLVQSKREIEEPPVETWVARAKGGGAEAGGCVAVTPPPPPPPDGASKI